MNNKKNTKIAAINDGECYLQFAAADMALAR
jgi:hypothetical protein